jgi:hypothetical protein
MVSSHVIYQWFVPDIDSTAGSLGRHSKQALQPIIRVARLWEDVRHFVINKSAEEFYRMKEAEELGPDNAIHLLCLHRLYMFLRSGPLDTFVQSWNMHNSRSVESKVSVR